MMTREEILALSDADLVAQVAEKIAIPLFCGEGATKKMAVGWDPLQDWNATMDVVTAMDANGFDWWIETEKGFSTVLGFAKGDAIIELRCDKGRERYHVLQAALLAVCQTEEVKP